MKFNCWFFLAGFFGLSALILEAFGSHALSNWLNLSGDELSFVRQSWQTATRYQLIHALLLLFLVNIASLQHQWNLKLAKILSALGVMLFCGGIYTKILTGVVLFGKLTPYGGICLMLSWACLMVTAFRLES